MHVKLTMTGKTSEKFIKEGMDFYRKRIVAFSKLELQEIKIPGKVKNPAAIKATEGEHLLRHMPDQFVHVRFDEKGKNFTSQEFAEFMEKQFVQGARGINFLIGGAYGFAQPVKSKARKSISLSAMTFSHQIVRLIALEQIYRALTIINNHPYHHS